MEKQISKEEIEHSLTYYMAAGMDSRKTLSHAVKGLLIWISLFFLGGLFLTLNADTPGSAAAVSILGYYFSLGIFVTVLWAEKIHTLLISYFVIPEREYNYRETDTASANRKPTMIPMPQALDGYRRNIPTMMVVNQSNGTEIKISEILRLSCKLVNVAAIILFWLKVIYENSPTTPYYLLATWAASPFIFAGAASALYQGYQLAQKKKLKEDTKKPLRNMLLGIGFAVLAEIICLILPVIFG